MSSLGLRRSPESAPPAEPLPKVPRIWPREGSDQGGAKRDYCLFWRRTSFESFFTRRRDQNFTCGRESDLCFTASRGFKYYDSHRPDSWKEKISPKRRKEACLPSLRSRSYGTSLFVSDATTEDGGKVRLKISDEFQKEIAKLIEDLSKELRNSLQDWEGETKEILTKHLDTLEEKLQKDTLQWLLEELKKDRYKGPKGEKGEKGDKGEQGPRVIREIEEPGELVFTIRK